MVRGIPRSEAISETDLLESNLNFVRIALSLSSILLAGKVTEIELDFPPIGWHFDGIMSNLLISFENATE